MATGIFGIRALQILTLGWASGMVSFGEVAAHPAHDAVMANGPSGAAHGLIDPSHPSDETKRLWGVTWRSSLDAVLAANKKLTAPHPIFLLRVLGDLEGDM